MRKSLTINANQMMFYVISIIDDEYYKTNRNEKEVFQNIYDNFNSEYNYPQNKIRYPNHQNRFSEWLRGLPTGLHFAFYNDDILELAKKQGLDVSTEKKQYKILDNYWNVLAMAFIKLFTKNKIEMNY